MYYVTVRKECENGREHNQGFMFSDEDQARRTFDKFADWLYQLECDGRLKSYNVGLIFQKT